MDVLAQIDFRKVQHEVLEIIALMLQKKDINVYDDKQIVENAMELWLACVLRS